MKKVLLIASLTLGVSALNLLAEDGGGPQQPPNIRPPRQGGQQGGDQGGERPHRPAPPLLAALDANHDGVIDAQEIANAPAALKTLDKNKDGQLTMDELRPEPRGDQQGPGGQQGGRRGSGQKPPGPPPGE